jgi:hypothetical protein
MNKQAFDLGRNLALIKRGYMAQNPKTHALGVAARRVLDAMRGVPSRATKMHPVTGKPIHVGGTTKPAPTPTAAPAAAAATTRPAPAATRTEVAPSTAPAPAAPASPTDKYTHVNTDFMGPPAPLATKPSAGAAGAADVAEEFPGLLATLGRMGGGTLGFIDPSLRPKMSDKALGQIIAGMGAGYGAKKYLEGDEEVTPNLLARGYIPRSLV